MELLVLVVGTAILTVLGIRVGMLLAPRVERWGAPRDPDTQHESPDDQP